MKRSLISQMLNEWKTNIWLVVELMVVCIVIWLIFAGIWFNIDGLFMPRGFDPEDVYVLDVKWVDEGSPYYIDMDKDQIYEDRNELLRRIRNNKNVEYASLQYNFLPYQYNYFGININIETLPDSITYYGNVRMAEPDIIGVLNIKSLTGKTHEELIESLRRGEILISDNAPFEREFKPVSNFMGMKAYFDGDSSNLFRIGDMVESVRRSDYEKSRAGTIIVPISQDLYDGSDFDSSGTGIILRVKSGKGKSFINDFKDDVSLRKLRNVYLSDLRSLDDMRDFLQRPTEVNIRLMVVISLFLLITIFLGLLGSFWFRVQQRVSEIAIRKTFGATDRSLFRRIIGEGLILLSVGIILASAIFWPFYETGIFYYSGIEWQTMFIIELIVVALMTIGVCVSLFYPAYKAMKIEPAIAVKEE